MNEIRFSNPHQHNTDSSVSADNKIKKPIIFLGFVSYLFKAVLFLVILFFVVWGGRYLFIRYISFNKNINSNVYSAIFLSNNQVYFGKIIKNNSREIVLNDVFYLQANNTSGVSGPLDQSPFVLVKLGQELHGPTDELFINRNQVVFYENLRDDSKIVESIKSQKVEKNY